jgi:exodeoxyribonuclease V beta subunit
MATAELRDRVRARLVTAEQLLGAAVDAGVPPPPEDRIACLLAEGDAAVVGARRTRLADALAVFDAATITTTHGFCQLILAGLGVAGRVGVGATLVEDAEDTVDEALDDLFLRRVLGWGVPSFGRKQARAIARAAVANPVTPLEPDVGDSVPGRQRRLAEAVRGEVGRRLLDQNLLTYDDLLVRLEQTLADPDRGAAACDMLRRRYRVVLVDEFQDTDPVQWEVVRRAFGDGRTILVLIGDPKQAIYAFRGADVYAYLEAARVARHRFTLTENWRSDAGLLAAYDALLHPLHVGHPDIPYRRVAAPPVHQVPGLEGAPVAAPLRARVLHLADGLVRRNSLGHAQKDAAVEWVAGDLAGDVVRLLGSPAQLIHPAPRPVSPGDVAVLVRTNRQAGIVQAALRAVGVPAVMGSTESVFGSTTAVHWLRLLEALEQPASRSRAVAAALTPFIGMTAAGVATAGETVWEDLHGRLHRWAEILRRHGVATLVRAVFAAQRVPGRVLVESTGERELTDLGHVAQLLHAEGSAGQLGATALRTWLARRIDESASETAEIEDRSRRLDSDADAVQVLTIHRAKGLEFPIVYCPYLWDSGNPPRSGDPVVFHDESHGHQRTLDVGIDGPSPSYLGHFELARDEQRGEELRLLYVALTRARHQAVVWWVRAKDAHHSPLGRLLMFRDGNGDVLASGKYLPDDADVQLRLERLAQGAPGLISVERGPALTGATWAPPAPPAPPLAAAAFERQLDLAWRRTSYTGITSSDYAALIASEPEAPGTIDEPAAPGGSAPPVAPDAPHAGGDEVRLRGELSGWAATPGGAEVGTFVHGVLQRVDFAAGDLTAEVAAAVAAEQARGSLDIGPVDALVAGIGAAIATPLGALTGGRSLRDIGRADRVDELGFEFPLAGGDRPAGEILTGDVARLFDRHQRPGILAGYGARLASPSLASHLRGYLSGSLDLVVRAHDRRGQPRFFLVDYKTNWLAPAGEELSAWHYRPAVLDAEMQRDHYPLQAVLYLVALHRYLRWRLPGYDPGTHLAGVLYLFVRGMLGATGPLVGGAPCGVFQWQPPTALIVGLSDLLDRGSEQG